MGEARDIILGCCSQLFPASGAIGEDIQAPQAQKGPRVSQNPAITTVTRHRHKQECPSSMHQGRVVFLSTHCCLLYKPTESTRPCHECELGNHINLTGAHTHTNGNNAQLLNVYHGLAGKTLSVTV